MQFKIPVIFILFAILLEMFVPKGEVFPFYSWSLFARIEKVEKFYLIRIRNWENHKFSPPLPVPLFHRRFSEVLKPPALKSLVMMGRTMKKLREQGNFSELEMLKRQSVQYFENTKVELELVKVKANALLLWTEGKVKKSEQLEIWSHENF